MYEDVTTLNNVTESFKRGIVYCINTALQDDRTRYLAEFQPDSTNGLPHQIGDWINTNIKNHLASENIEVHDFKRTSWNGRIIIDHFKRVTYTVMRAERLREVVRDIRNGKRTTLHYLQTIIYNLNDHLNAPGKQIGMMDAEGRANTFDAEYMARDYESIFNGVVGKDSGYYHCIVLYDTKRFNLEDVAMVVLDKDFDEVERISLNEYIRPDFAKLTETEVNDNQDYEAAEEADSGQLISIIRHDETSETPVELRENKKQA